MEGRAERRRMAVTFLGARLVIAAFLVLAMPFASMAQPAKKVVRVGVLSDESPSVSSELLSDLTVSKALRELGWAEGENVTFERRYSAGKIDALPALAAELVRLQVDVILAIGTPAAGAAKNATVAIPIVFTRAGDPVGFGLAQSLARPGGNVTGVTILTVALGAKRLDLLREAIPGISRVGVLWDPSFPPGAPELKDMRDAARSLRLDILSAEVRRPEEIEDAVMALKRQHAAALIVVVTRILTQHRQRLAEIATKARLPMMSYRREIVEAGGLMSYGPNYHDMDRRAAIYVDKILKGAKPGDLPIEQPTRVELTVNLKTARALGLIVPSSLLLRADQVVE